MKYIDFNNAFKNRLLIDVREVRQIFPDFESRRFYEWQKKDNLIIWGRHTHFSILSAQSAKYLIFWHVL